MSLPVSELAVVVRLELDGRMIPEFTRTFPTLAPLIHRAAAPCSGNGAQTTLISALEGIQEGRALVLTTTAPIAVLLNGQVDGIGIPLAAGGLLALTRTHLQGANMIVVKTTTPDPALVRAVVIGYGNP